MGKTIRVLEPFTGQIAAEHQLVAPGEVSVIDEDYGSAQPDKPRRAPRARTDDEKQFLALGDPAAAFLAGAAAARVSTLGREISQILSLQAAHGDAALVAALERGAEFGRWRADDVRSVLAAAAPAPLSRHGYLRNAKLQLSAVLAPGDEVPGLYLHYGCRKPMPPGDIRESRLRRGRAAGGGRGPGR